MWPKKYWILSNTWTNTGKQGHTIHITSWLWFRANGSNDWYLAVHIWNAYIDLWICVSSISMNWEFHDIGPFKTARTSHTEDVVDDIIPHKFKISICYSISIYIYISVQIQYLDSLSHNPLYFSIFHHITIASPSFPACIHSLTYRKDYVDPANISRSFVMLQNDTICLH